MRKGMSVPIVIILLMLFLVVVAGIFGKSYISESQEVKGMKSKSIPTKGFSVVLNTKGAWDLYQYLCVDLEECTKSAFSGKRYAVVSGGSQEGHEVLVPYNKTWENYKYMKVFVKPAFGSSSDRFIGVLSANLSDGLTSKILKEQNEEIELFILSLDKINQSYVSEVVKFSQN